MSERDRYCWDGLMPWRLPGYVPGPPLAGDTPPEQAAIEAAVQREDARAQQSYAMKIAMRVSTESGARFAAQVLASAFDLRGER